MCNKFFFDTNALLILQDKAFKKNFVIAQKTLEEIENIKTSNKKDEETKFRARHLSKLLKLYKDMYEIVPYDNRAFKIILNKKGLDDTPDNLIVVSAYIYGMKEPILFCTNDLNCNFIANKIFNLSCSDIDFLESLYREDEYLGYKTVEMNDDDLAYLYNHIKNNKYKLNLNEYLIVNNNNELVDALRWDGEEYKRIKQTSIRSKMFGKIRPKDIYQSCIIDSIYNNTMTAISGKAGSGKTLISLMTIMNLIENGQYDKVVIMFNPTKAKGSSDMGYYSGNAIEKAMQNSIGSILTTKFGDRYIIDELIAQNKLKLISMADIRGMEIKDNEILYITECQNTSRDLLKLCLTRASSESKIVIEGDFESQVDSYLFEGNSNGMKCVINLLKGHKEFGYIKLPNVWRSKIASLIANM